MDFRTQHKQLDVKNYARQLALAKIPVFPCNRDKTPAPRIGYKAATTSPETIGRLWWGGLIGMPTGHGSGFSVLDLDLPKHEEARSWYSTHCRQLPDTLVVETRSGGLHLFFEHREGIGSTAGTIALGVDTRGDGGYVILWHPDRLLDAVSCGNAIAPWPHWLKPSRHASRQTAVQGSVIADRYQIIRLAMYVAESREGQRNSRLYWAACRLAEMSFVRPEYREAAVDHLVVAAIRAGLDQREAERTVQSGLSASRERA